MIARWLATLAGVVALSWTTWLVAPHVPVAPVAGAALAFALVCAAALASAWSAPPFGLRALGWLVVPVLAVGVVASMGDRAQGIGVACVVLAALLGGGTLAGAAIGARIQHPSHLLVAAYASSAADVFSVLSPSGPSAQVVESEQLLSLLAMSWAIPGTAAIAPLLGVGDVILCALYVIAARQLGLPVARTVAALAVAFAAVLVALWLVPAPLPALPFLGVAVVAAHPETRRFRPHERGAALVGMAVLTAVLAVLWCW